MLPQVLAVRTNVSVARATLLLCVLAVSLCALRTSSLRVLCPVFRRRCPSSRPSSPQLSLCGPRRSPRYELPHSLANLLNPSVPTQEGQAACGHCKVEEYELLFSCWASYGWGHVRTHTPPGATAKADHHFYFNKDPPSFINATDAGGMAFKNECGSVRSAGASLLRGSAKKGASAARALATGAKVKTTAVKDEQQPLQQQVRQQQLQQQAAVQQATLQLLQQ